MPNLDQRSTRRSLRLTNKVICTYGVHRVLQVENVGNARTVEYTSDGSNLICCTSSALGVICAYNGEIRSVLPVQGRWVNPASARILHHDGATQAIVAARQKISSVDISRGDWLRHYAGHQAVVSSISAEPAGAQGGFASCDDRGNVFLWDRRQEQPAKKFRTGRSPRLAYDPLGIVLFTATSNRVYAYDPRRPNSPFLQFPIESIQSSPPLSFEVSPDGKFIALSFPQPTRPAVWLYDAHNGELLNAFECQSKRSSQAHPFRAVFSPEASMLAAGYSDASLQFWNVRDSSPVYQTPPAAHSNPLVDVAFNPFLAQLASVSSKSEVALWMPNIHQLDDT